MASKKAITCVIETITPKIAEQYLKKNIINNRKINQNIKGVIGALNRDEWVINGDTIKFNINGGLFDGQHRLRACIETNKPILTLVVRNLPVEALETIDNGTCRSFADMLTLKEAKQPNNQAGTTRLLTQFLRGQPYTEHGKNDMTFSLMLKVYNAYEKDIIDSLKYHNYNKQLFVPSASGLIGMILANCKARNTSGFFEKFCYGDNLNKRDPLYKLRNRLLTNRIELVGKKKNITRISKRVVVNSAFKVFNHHASKNAVLEEYLWDEVNEDMVIPKGLATKFIERIDLSKT